MNAGLPRDIGLPQDIIDAHVHLWNRSRTPQDWIDPQSMAAIDRDFWFDDLDEVLRSNAVSGAVVVQASNSALETNDLLTSELPATVLAIVGWVDLESPAVAEEIASALAKPNGGRLVGIRHLAHLESDPSWLTRPAVSRGLDALTTAGLSFDLVVRADQLGECASVVSRHPEARFVLDHLGKPPIRSGDLDEWQAALHALAAFPNVSAKLSGLTMEAHWATWLPSDLGGAINEALEAFGPARLMFGSDWPLVQLCGGYAAWLDAAQTILVRLSSDERAAIFAGTARTAYRIPEVTHA